MPAPVQRKFTVTKPPMSGNDVRAWKTTVLQLFKNIGIDAPIDANNVYNTNTQNVCKALIQAIGLDVKEVMADNAIGPAERSKIKTQASTHKATPKDIEFRNALKAKWDTAAAKKAATKAPAKPVATIPVKAEPVKEATPVPKATAAKPPAKPTVVTSLNGFDVSGNQPGNVTSLVDGDFAIIKATEGVRYTNPYLTAQITGAKKTGKMIGLYHFADTNAANLEAQHFYSIIKPYLGVAVLILDFEGAALKNGPTWALTFLNRLKALCGVSALIYGSRGNICIAGFEAVAEKYELWVAAYALPPATKYSATEKPGTITPWKSARMFQYSDVGRLDGYSGDLDLDIFYGNDADWRKLALRS